MNIHDSTGHEQACKKAAPDDICTNCGAYEFGLVRDICQQCKAKLFGRELTTEEERALAIKVLEWNEKNHPRAHSADHQVPHFEPYEPYEDYEDERMWTTRFSIWTPGHYFRIETRSRFPWIRTRFT